MSRISQSDDESTNSPMYITVFFSFYKKLYHKCILCYFFSFSEWEKKHYIIVVIFYVVFLKTKRKKMFLKQLFQRLYSQCKHIQSASPPFFVLQKKMIAMFSRIFMVNGFFFQLSMFCYVQLNIKYISSGWIIQNLVF